MHRFRRFAVSTLMALAVIGPALYPPGPSVAQPAAYTSIIVNQGPQA